jgi:serine/threonine protein kinase
MEQKITCLGVEYCIKSKLIVEMETYYAVNNQGQNFVIKARNEYSQECFDIELNLCLTAPSNLGIPKLIAHNENFMIFPVYKKLANNKLDLQEVLQITIQIIKTLQFIHSQGYIHGDIHSNYIQFDDKGKVVLTNFELTTKYKTEGSHLCDGTELKSVFWDDDYNPSRHNDIFDISYWTIWWLCGTIPHIDWNKIQRLNDKYVEGSIMYYKLVKLHPVISHLKEYLMEVFKLKYGDQPDYENLIKLLEKELL